MEQSEICLQCMQCCKWNGFVVTAEPGKLEQMMQMYEWRGCEIKSVKGNQIFMIAPMQCKHLTQFGCSIYPHRPKWCRDYDGRTDPAMKDKCLLNEEV